MRSTLRKVVPFVRRFGVALGYVATTFTFGLATKKHRGVLARLAREAGLREGPALELPRVEIDEITNRDTAIVLPFLHEQEGSITLLELTTLARLVRTREPRDIFEIGTFDGRTTSMLAANSPANATVYTLDLPADKPTKFAVDDGETQYIQKSQSGRLLKGQAYTAKVKQLFGDSATFDFAPYRATFVFVDGSHAYSYVKSDSQNALAVLGGKGGTIVWHDYGEWPGVTRALNELRKDDARFAGLRHVSGTSLAILEVSDVMGGRSS